MVSPVPESTWPSLACTGPRTCPRAALRAVIRGNALTRAPLPCVIVITINATAPYWTWRLSSLVVGAVRSGWRRSKRQCLRLLLGFFSVNLHLAVITALTATATAAPLLSRSRSALCHRGHAWPLGGAPPCARTVARPAGCTPSCALPWAGTPSTCTTASSSAAARTSPSQTPRSASVTLAGPPSSRGAELMMPPTPPTALRAAAVRLPARDGNGADCCLALARASSQGGGEEFRRMRGARMPTRTQEGPGPTFTGERGPEEGGAILPGTVLPTTLWRRIATPPPVGGVGVAELFSSSCYATTSTPLAASGMSSG